MEFNKFYGKNSLSEYCLSKTGCKPYSGEGIGFRKDKDTCILRSVDNTYYYCDNLDNKDLVEYTLFGHNGDQDINQTRYNKPLLNCSNIYLYRSCGKSLWIWYGKYKIINWVEKQHIGKDGIERMVVILKMKKIDV